MKIWTIILFVKNMLILHHYAMLDLETADWHR